MKKILAALLASYAVTNGQAPISTQPGTTASPPGTPIVPIAAPIITTAAQGTTAPPFPVATAPAGTTGAPGTGTTAAAVITTAAPGAGTTAAAAAPISTTAAAAGTTAGVVTGTKAPPPPPPGTTAANLPPATPAATAIPVIPPPIPPPPGTTAANLPPATTAAAVPPVPPVTTAGAAPAPPSPPVVPVVTPSPTTGAPTTAAPTFNPYCPPGTALHNIGQQPMGLQTSQNAFCQTTTGPNSIARDWQGMLDCGTYHCCLCSEINCGGSGIPCEHLKISDSGAVGVQNIVAIGSPTASWGFMGWNNGAEIECNGLESCKAGIIKGQYVGKMQCSGDFSCQGTSITLEPNDQMDVQCNGMMSCMNANIDIVIGPQTMVSELGTIECNGQQSCQGLTVKIRNLGATPVLLRDLECMNPTACPNFNIILEGNIMIENCDLQGVQNINALPLAVQQCQLHQLGMGPGFNQQPFNPGFPQFPVPAPAFPAPAPAFPQSPLYPLPPAPGIPAIPPAPLPGIPAIPPAPLPGMPVAPLPAIPAIPPAPLYPAPAPAFPAPAPAFPAIPPAPLPGIPAIPPAPLPGMPAAPLPAYPAIPPAPMYPAPAPLPAIPAIPAAPLYPAPAPAYPGYPAVPQPVAPVAPAPPQNPAAPAPAATPATYIPFNAAFQLDCTPALCANKIMTIQPANNWRLNCPLPGSCSGLQLTLNVGMDPLNPGQPVERLDSLTCSGSSSCVNAKITINTISAGPFPGWAQTQGGVELNDIRCENIQSCTGLTVTMDAGVDFFGTNVDCQWGSCNHCTVNGQDCLSLNQMNNFQSNNPFANVNPNQFNQNPYNPPYQPGYNPQHYMSPAPPPASMFPQTQTNPAQIPPIPLTAGQPGGFPAAPFPQVPAGLPPPPQQQYNPYGTYGNWI